MLEQLKNKAPHWLGLVPFVFLLFWMSVVYLNHDFLWNDELIQFVRSDGTMDGPVDYGRILERVRGSQSWPPVHSLVGAAWATLAGWSEFSVRTSSLFTGVLVVPITYQLGRVMFSRRIGFIAAIMVSTTAFFAYYLHEFRGYTLYVLFSAMSVLFYWLATYRDHNRWLMRILMSMSLLALLHTHYGAAFTAGVIGVFHLFLSGKRDKHWLYTLIVLGITALAFLPWLTWALSGVLERELGESEGIDTLTLIYEWGRAFSNGIIPLLIGLVAFGIYRADKEVDEQEADNKAMLFSMTWLFLGALMLLTLNGYISFLLHIRHGIGLLLPAVLIMAFALDRIMQWQPIITIAILSIWVGLGVVYNQNFEYMYTFTETFRTVKLDSLRTGIEFGGQCAADDDLVVFMHAEDNPATERLIGGPMAYYVGDSIQRFAQIDNIMDMRRYNPNSGFLFHAPDYATMFAETTADAPIMWVVGVERPVRPHFFLGEFNALAADAYEYCGQVVRNDEILAYAYTNTSTVTCEFPEMGTVELAPCAPGLIQGGDR